MRQRCSNPKATGYCNYGGRGIKVCERWMSFKNFITDMGEPPEGMSLERIDNDGNYEPNNCKWGTRPDQARNRRSNKLLMYKGQILCAKDWSKKLGLSYSTLQWRLNSGWSIADALTSTKTDKWERAKNG